MRTLPDRYATVGRRDFRAALEYLLETEFKLVGSHRVIRLIAEAVVELQRQFYPEHEHLEPGTILWATTFRNRPEDHPWVSPAELIAIRGGAAPAHAPGATRRAEARVDSSERRRTPWRQIVRRMWLATAVDFCYGWSLWVFLTWLPSYLSDARGFAIEQMALATMLPFLAGVVSDTLGGVVSDAIYRRTGNLRLARDEAELAIVRDIVAEQSALGVDVHLLESKSAIRTLAPRCPARSVTSTML